MTRRRDTSRCLLASALVLAACASRPTTARTPPPAADGADALAPASLRVLHGDRVECTLSPDGRIEIDGRLFARVEGDRVVSASGRELARVEGGSVRFAGAAVPASLSADGALGGPDGQRMTFDEEGHPVFASPSHPGEPLSLSTRVEGVTPATRRTAAVLVGVMMFRARELRADGESP